MADWDQVRSHDEVETQRRAGQLVPVYLLPSELGGTASAENIVYLPPAAGAEKDATTAELIALVRDGGASRVSITPEYRGESFVPAMLHVKAWGDNDKATYDRDLTIW